ncbi:hypothetical protein [Nocardia noduli]|uniref:hypothetical protein n=1 Tax=Nocardia noduli TaxID=2815722 RepID=UPI001C22DF26|nr:hypothetical protein [Nocardia noduli]
MADELLALDLELVRQSGRGAVNIDANLTEAALVQAVRDADRLGFADEYSAAYHPYKHEREYPTIEKIGLNEIDAYQNSAAKTVREGRLVDYYLDPETGATKLVFHRLIDDGTGRITTTEAIVWVDREGRASLASYGKPKAKKLGPNKDPLPEYSFDRPGERPPTDSSDDVETGPTHLPRPILVVPPLLSLRPRQESSDAPFDAGAAGTAPWAVDLLQRLRETLAIAQQTVPHPISGIDPVGPIADRRVDQSLTFNVSVPQRRADLDAESYKVLTYSAHLS